MNASRVKYLAYLAAAVNLGFGVAYGRELADARIVLLWEPLREIALILSSLVLVYYAIRTDRGHARSYRRLGMSTGLLTIALLILAVTAVTLPNVMRMQFVAYAVVTAVMAWLLGLRSTREQFDNEDEAESLSPFMGTVSETDTWESDDWADKLHRDKLITHEDRRREDYIKEVEQ
ncbi:hypothetical protein [Catellatospora vulcania]|uniref:hypothetical protein n=1 Tax=Catellatospora vulcania TaxID=1460450 RepID=UPI0012D38771|nr:hypothetical protein [Catellatospora vulcania]